MIWKKIINEISIIYVQTIQAMLMIRAALDAIDVACPTPNTVHVKARSKDMINACKSILKQLESMYVA